MIGRPALSTTATTHGQCSVAAFASAADTMARAASSVRIGRVGSEVDGLAYAENGAARSRAGRAVRT
jgi:hypothetical protein